MGYKFFDHTADVMFQASGESLSDAFNFAALAMTVYWPFNSKILPL